MSIERIKQEAAKADQLIMELAQRADSSTSDESPEVETSEITPEAVQPEVDQQQTDQGVVADAATEDQNDADVSRLLDESKKWEQRYRSLDGMIQARDRQIEQLHQLLASMQQAQAAPETPAKQDKAKLVGKEDEDAFGADLVDLARRVAREESGAYVSKLESTIAELQQQLKGVAQTTAVTVQDRFENQLTAAVPNWKAVDGDPKFIEWLQGSATRMKVFSEAARNQDVDGVAYFYSEYAGAPKTEKPATDPRLAKQVAPGKSKAVAPAAKSPAEKKTWTRSEIAQFYADGKKRFSQEDYIKLERDLFAAQKEGRVDYTR